MAFKTVFMAVGDTPGRRGDRPRGDDLRAGSARIWRCSSLGIAPPPPASPYGVVSNDIWAGEIRDGQDEAQARAEEIEARLAGGRALVLGRGAVHRPRHGRAARRALRALRRPDAGHAAAARVRVDAELGDGRRALRVGAAGAAACRRAPTSFPEAKMVMIGWDASVRRRRRSATRSG